MSPAGQLLATVDGGGRFGQVVRFFLFSGTGRAEGCAEGAVVLQHLGSRRDVVRWLPKKLILRSMS